MQDKTSEYIVSEDRYECRSHDGCSILVVYLARTLTPHVVQVVRTLHLMSDSTAQYPAT